MRPIHAILAILCLMPLTSASPPGWLSHDDCGRSTHRVVVFEIWLRSCAGVVVHAPPCFAPERHVDQDVPETNHTVHVLVASGWGCQTGVILEPFP
ncbi:MAG TPA: hypothetical protein VHH36_00090 [Candidatus Thermoplasmatota archaeon]|nr:hypothetical protein [Candidatus Thermoplasmatota archaeon]